MVRLRNFAGIQRPKTSVISKKNKFPDGEQLDQCSMTAFDLLSASHENSYLPGVLGAKRNDRVPFAVVHAADDNPFHPV
jgi:hypothetical protein